MMCDIATLVGRLKDIRWVWSVSGMNPVFAALTATPVETVPGRWTYIIASGLKLSVYMEDDRIEFLEITMDVFFDPQRLQPEEYERKVDEYFSKYEKAVASAERILGPPTFNDGWGSEGFPEDQEAVWLAQWDLLNARLMIQQKHEDKELPFRLCIVITPPVDFA